MLYLEHYLINFLQTCMRVDLRKECYGIAYPLNLSNNYIVMALDLNLNKVSALDVCENSLLFKG